MVIFKHTIETARGSTVFHCLRVFLPPKRGYVHSFIIQILFMFFIDSIKLRLIGNYLNYLDTTNLKRCIVSEGSIDGYLGNLKIHCNTHSIYITGSVSKFMGVNINHSNINFFIDALSDALNIEDIIHSKIIRLDIATDLQTTKNIHVIDNELIKLRYYKKVAFENSIYFQTSKHKHKGTKLVIYQKSKKKIRMELRTFKNSKYHIKRLSEVKRVFLELCEVIIDLYKSIVKTPENIQLKMISNNKDLSEVKTRLILQLGGQKMINKLIKLIDSRSHGYKMKSKILNELQTSPATTTNDIELLIETNLNNTKKLRYD